MYHREKIIYFFGATGDLARHKLWPAIAQLFKQGELFKVMAFGRGFNEDTAFKNWLQKQLPDTRQDLEQFLAHVHFESVDLLDPNQPLPIDLSNLSAIFYIALSTHLYQPLLQKLAPHLPNRNCRIVLEKPIGTQLEDATQIQAFLRTLFTEDQIYRIDHYLGKRTVQNVMALRFANSIFEYQWNQKYIDHIQITIAEVKGIEGRVEFYDNIGALRDMVQNHLVQLLCLVAMEPPASLHAEAIRDERVKVLRALKPLALDQVVRGQYQAGVIAGTPAMGYQDEVQTAPPSKTETFIALKAEIDNWRWAGVPFYLRTGKRLPIKCCEIVVQFKSVPHPIFHNQKNFGGHNRLIFRLQPDESVKIELFEQTGEDRHMVRPAKLSLVPNARAKGSMDAYERLILDSLLGDPTLFVREDEWAEAWKWVDPILQHWSNQAPEPCAYLAGTWGPTESISLLARERRTWENPE